MGKYTKLEQDVFSIFGSAAWVAEAVSAFPSNYSSAGATESFVRVTVLANGSGLNIKSANGVLQIDIFTKTGDGPQETYRIADVLDKFLVGKSIKLADGSTQLGGSSLAEMGRDSDNPVLYRALYSIPFNYFGV